MSRVYSRQLAIGSLAEGDDILVYTCPPGVTAIVRDIELTPVTAPPSFAAIDVSSSTANVFSVFGGAAYSSLQWQGRVVLKPGDTINAYAGQGSWMYIISGYELGP